MKRKGLLLGGFLLSSMYLMAYETPTMGWSSWNTYRVNISESAIKKQAQAMHDKGLGQVGYQYINIDDGYFGGRNNKGKLLIHPTRFPNGLKPVVDFIHNLGFKAGIYSDAGRNTCGSFWDGDKIGVGVGMYGNDQQDADFFFKELDFDFIKVDFCGGDPGQNTEGLDLNERERYTAIRKAIEKTGKQNVRMNVCRWAFPGTWVHDVATSWRIDADINMSWGAVKRIIDRNLFLSAYATEGKFNDMDIMEVGRGLSEEEDKTHFGMWCIMSSPLMIGCDITTINEKTLTLLTNTELIALNQDPLAIQAEVVEKQGNSYILAKDIETRFGKTRAVAFYNSGDTDQTINIDLRKLALGGNVQIRDLYEHTDLVSVEDSYFSIDVPAHGTRIYRMEAEERLEQRRFEAENAWLDKYSAIASGNFARVMYNENFSSGAYVGYLGDIDDTDNYMEWRTVYSKAGGEYTLNIAYISAENRNLAVQVNHMKKQVIKNLNSGSWSTVSTVQMTIQLQPGVNTIRLSNTPGAAPNIDYIEVIPAEEESETLTYYYPTERARNLSVDKAYMLYNTAMWNGQDRTNFVFSNGSGLSTNKTRPEELFVDNDAYLFTLEKNGEAAEPELYYLKSKHGYTGTNGVTNNKQPQPVYINYWTENMDITLGATECRMPDGSTGNPKDADVWTITKRNEAAESDGETDYGWNGNINSWSSWSNAHPYAFYEVASKTFGSQVKNQMRRIDESKSNLSTFMPTLQEEYSLVKTTGFYSCNAPESEAYPLSTLLDSNPNTFFHSNYSKPSEGAHYLQADLDKSTTSAYFYFRKREDNNNNRPVDITVSVRLEGSDTFTEVSRITQGLPTKEDCPDYLSTEITANGQPFNAIRFIINKTNNGATDPSGHVFFTFSEFYVLEGNSDTKPYFDAMHVSLRENTEEEIKAAYMAVENSFVEKEFAAQELSAYLKSIEGMVGNAYGQYQETEVYQKALNTATALLNDLASCTVKDLQNALSLVEGEFSFLTLKLPATGFYRFKGKVSGHYMDGTMYDNGTDGQMSMATEAGKTSIFYLTDNNKLLNYANGTYLHSTRATNAIGAENGDMVSIALSESNQYGFCTLKTDNSDAPYIADNTDCIGSQNAYTADICDWFIEDVTELPVSIGTSGWSTLCAPVALTIPEEMTVYYINNEDMKDAVTIKTLTGTIPAHLPVLLQAAQGEYTFTISTEDGTAPEDVSTEAKGTSAGKIAVATDGSTYVLAVLKSTGKVGFARNMTGVIPGFKAYLAPATTTSQEEYNIRFEDFTNGIQHVNARSQQNTEYYDLSGQRVFFPSHGIYVTNKGEKIFIK